jgi:hypothetical protein
VKLHTEITLFSTLSATSIDKYGGSDISGSHGGKHEVFWDVVSCSLVEVDRRFRAAYSLHNRPDDGGSADL